MNHLIIGLALLSLASLSQAGTVKVYAAASLTNAMTDIAMLYEKQYPKTNIIPILGASSALARQIEAGANSDIFFSADLDWMNYLIKKNMITENKSKTLLSNQLVLISPKNLNISFKAQPNFSFARSFKGYLCTSQMESVPAGKYAKQSLIKLNWLNSLKGRIVGTDDVRSSLAFVERGECDLGIVYRTDALISKKVNMVGAFPKKSHHPILYPLALTKQGEKNADAIRFKNFLISNAQAKMIFKKYGFSISQ